MPDNLRSRKNTARYAGLLYLLMALTTAFSLLIMPSRIVVKGNALQALQNLLAQETTVRWIIVSHFAGHIFFLLLAMVFYRLFKAVNDHSMRLLVLFVAVQVPLIFVGETLNFTALLTAKGELLTSFPMTEKADIVLLLERIRSYLLLAAEVFWALWLIPLGQVFFTSGFMPRILGVLLVIGGAAYLVQTFAYILSPNVHSIIVGVTDVLPSIAEIAAILWLLIMGTTDKTTDKTSIS